VGENNLKIKKKTKFKKKFNKIFKLKEERDITARLNNKDGHFLDEYERQNQEIRERLKEKLIYKCETLSRNCIKCILY